MIIALGLLLLSMMPTRRCSYYEMATTLRSAFTLVTLIIAWLHVSSRDQRQWTWTWTWTWNGNSVCLLIASVLLVAGGVFRIGRTAYRSCVFSRPLPQISVTAWREHEVMRARLQLPRPWRVQPGQYLRLTLFDPTSRVVVQSRAFPIAWWEMARDEPDGAATSHNIRPVPPNLQSIPPWYDLCLDGHATNDTADCVQAERDVHDCLPLQVWLLMRRSSTWARHLARSCRGQVLAALVDGPYGTPPDLAQYGQVVLFATGMGIVAQMPFIKTLSYESQAGHLPTRRVSLIWEVHSGRKSLAPS